MPVHSEKRVLPYTAEQMFDLVVGIDRYPEFLPWCLASRIKERADGVLLADLVIGFKIFRERFGSRVAFERPSRIEVRPTAGPFRRMTNDWRFEDRPEGGCLIDFHVDFQFRSRLLDKLIGPLFHEAVRKMVAAFEARARQLYGPADGALAKDTAA